VRGEDGVKGLNRAVVQVQRDAEEFRVSHRQQAHFILHFIVKPTFPSRPKAERDHTVCRAHSLIDYRRREERQISTVCDDTTIRPRQRTPQRRARDTFPNTLERRNAAMKSRFVILLIPDGPQRVAGVRSEDGRLGSLCKHCASENRAMQDCPGADEMHLNVCSL
jgi:hypothetical protein